MLARSMGFSESANLMVSVKLCSDDPCCHGNENLPNFNRKFAITLLVGEIRPQFLHRHRVSRVGEFNCANKICITPTPVAMVTKISKF